MGIPSGNRENMKFWYIALLGGYLAQEEDVEPEPEGEPEPELDCYVCTGAESLDSCAANQTDSSPIETCAPGFHCSTYFVQVGDSIIYHRGCSRSCDKSCIGHYDAEDSSVLTFASCYDCCDESLCNAGPLAFSTGHLVSIHLSLLITLCFL